MTRPSDYWPDWFFKRMSRSYGDALLRHYKDDLFEHTVKEEIDLTLQEIRWRHAIKPWLQLARSAIQIVRLTREKIHGQYRKTVEKIRRRSNTPSSDGPGANSNSGSVGAVPQSVSSGHGGGLASTPVGAGLISGARAASRFVVSSAFGSLGDFINEKKIEEGGIKAGEIVAHRCWILKEDGLLYSTYEVNFCWKPGAPVEGNVHEGNGIHAFKDLINMAAYGRRRQNHAYANIVSGTVWLWGDVVEHERGYRASYAAIRSIDNSPFYDAKAIRKTYSLTRSRRKR